MARKKLPRGTPREIEYDERFRWLVVRRGPFELACNFGSGPVTIPCQGETIELSAGGDAHLSGGSLKLPAHGGSAGSVSDVWPGRPFPLGADLGRAGNELQPVLRARQARDAVPVRRRGQRDADRDRHPPGAQLALLPARGRARPALRLPRARALRAQGGPPLQPQQAPHRPLRQGDRRRGGLGPRRQRAALRPARQPRERRGCRPGARRRGRLGRRPQVRGHRRQLRLAGRPPAPDPVRRHDHLRDPRQGLHHDPPRRAR